MIRALHITVEAYAGGLIPDLIRQQCELADRIGIDVHAKWNGVKVMASPGDDPVALAIAWEKQLAQPVAECAKIACVRQATQSIPIEGSVK